MGLLNNLRARSVSIVVGSLCLTNTAVYGQADFTNGKSVYDIPLPAPDLRYPVKDNAASMLQVFAKPDAYDGVASSVQGTVGDIRLNSRGQPIVQIQLDGETGVFLWASWVTPLNTSPFLSAFFSLGERLRISGWLVQAAGFGRKVVGPELPVDPPISILAICLVKVMSSDVIMDQKYVRYCDGWERGQLPPDMRMRQ